MAGTPEFKVYTANGEYVAACKFLEDAAAIVNLHGDGATIRHGHTRRSTLYTNGIDGDAGDSYDEAAALARTRLSALASGYSWPRMPV